MITGEYYNAGDAPLKDRRAKNLLHRLNVTEYRITKKSKRNHTELIRTRVLIFIEPPFHCDYTISFCATMLF
jgi:maltose O-acetyltransferase